MIIYFVAIFFISFSCKSRKEEPRSETLSIDVDVNEDGVLSQGLTLRLDKVHSNSSEQMALPQCAKKLEPQELVAELYCKESSERQDIRASQTTQICSIGEQIKIKATQPITNVKCRVAQLVPKKHVIQLGAQE
jgi:hypothetical protein